MQVAEISPAYQQPVTDRYPILSAICRSIARVFRRPIEVVDFDKLEERQLSKTLEYLQTIGNIERFDQAFDEQDIAAEV